jgi:predicted DNA-binding transcriptional regulator YafY
LARIVQHVNANPNRSIRALAQELKIGVATLYRYLPAVRAPMDPDDV